MSFDLDCIGGDVAMYRITLDNGQEVTIVETPWGFVTYERDDYA